MAAWPTVPHVLFTFHGGLPGGEVWNCGLRTTRADPNIDGVLFQTLANSIADTFSTFVNLAHVLWAASVTYTGLTARTLDSNGVTVRLAEGAPTIAGVGDGIAVCPNQVSWAVTLLTARAGRTGKGRFFLPMLTAQINAATGVIGPGNPGQLATWVADLVGLINIGLEVLPDSPVIGVQSGTQASNADASYDGAAVTAISVGNVLDTQRRRRNAFREIYAAAPVP